MNATNSDKPLEQPRLTVNLAGTKHRLSVERTSSLAHQLVCHEKLDSATAVLELLEQTLPNDRRVKVLHARCEALQSATAPTGCRSR